MARENQLVVDLGDRSYAIRFSPLASLPEHLAEHHAPARCVLVTNPVVGALYAETCRAALEAAGWEVIGLEVPDGEAHKTLETWEDLVQALLGVVDRNTPVLALGGGVTGDLVGFAAASTLRGLPLVQIPTTLLAMVDSSVGGKTGVNTGRGKNLVGAFYQPALVHVDVRVLETLSPEEFRCGLGEVVKHALLADADFFSFLEESASAILARDEAVLAEVVQRCCAIKAEVVRQDERESGYRAVLNLGHTVAHALENALGYGRLRHGEAVAIGLVAEARLAVDKGWSPPELPGRISALNSALGLPNRAPPVPREDCMRAVNVDKKMSRGKLRLPISMDIGRVRLLEVNPMDLAGALAWATSPEENA